MISNFPDGIQNCLYNSIYDFKTIQTVSNCLNISRLTQSFLDAFRKMITHFLDMSWEDFWAFVPLFLINRPSRWSLYLSLALCVDHLNIIYTERRVQQCSNLLQAFTKLKMLLSRNQKNIFCWDTLIIYTTLMEKRGKRWPLFEPLAVGWCWWRG